MIKLIIICYFDNIDYLIFKHYRTALHWACKRNHIIAVKYLLEHGADKSIQNSSKEVAAQLTNTAEIRHILDCT